MKVTFTIHRHMFKNNLGIILSLLIILSAACTQEQPIESPFDDVERPSFLSNENNTTTGIKEDYINTNRHSWQKPEMIIDMLGSLENKVIADLGAGGRGFFSLILVKRDCEKVIALDTDSLALRTLDTTLQRELTDELQPKLELRITPPEMPNIAKEEIDIAFISNTYIYLPNRVEYMSKLRESLKAGGKIMIIDFKRKKTPLGPQAQFKVPLYIVEEELEAAGYSTIRSNDVALDYQYIVIAEK